MPVIDLKTGKLATEEINRELQSENLKKEMSKNNISPEAAKKVSDFFSGLTPEQRNVLERVFRSAMDSSRQSPDGARGRENTPSHPLELEKNPATRQKVLDYAKRFREAKTEEDKMMVEGLMRMEGVDFDGSKQDMESGQPPKMLAENSPLRLSNLFVGLIQFAIGLFRKIGGKKTEIKKGQPLELSDKELASTPAETLKALLEKGKTLVANEKKTLNDFNKIIKSYQTDLAKPGLPEEESKQLKTKLEEAIARRDKQVELIQRSEKTIGRVEGTLSMLGVRKESKDEPSDKDVKSSEPDAETEVHGREQDAEKEKGPTPESIKNLINIMVSYGTKSDAYLKNAFRVESSGPDQFVIVVDQGPINTAKMTEISRQADDISTFVQSVENFPVEDKAAKISRTRPMSAEQVKSFLDKLKAIAMK